MSKCNFFSMVIPVGLGHVAFCVSCKNGVLALRELRNQCFWRCVSYKNSIFGVALVTKTVFLALRELQKQ